MVSLLFEILLSKSAKAQAWQYMEFKLNFSSKDCSNFKDKKIWITIELELLREEIKWGDLCVKLGKLVLGSTTLNIKWLSFMI